MQLSSAQLRAISLINQKSKGNSLDRSLRVTLNFHPDRISSDVHILDSILASGVYKSQFETKTSNGGLTAHPGGDRWKWESRIFGGAYDNDISSSRPKYGALNYKRDAYGASPRFGSAYIRLNESVLDRTTFCYPDSVFVPDAFGTAEHMSLVGLALKDDKDLLDDYVEAHVHGDIRLSEDVEAIVLDPAYIDTYVERLALKLPCAAEWHNGYALTLSEMAKYPNYRGSEYIELAREIAHNGVITPHDIGEAANTGKYELQDLKKIWHYVARYGTGQSHMPLHPQ